MVRGLYRRADCGIDLGDRVNGNIPMPKYHLTLKSSNRKTGPMPVSTTSAETCPPSCGIRNECYAKSGPLAMVWNKVSNTGVSLREFTAMIKALPYGQLWRHNQAGDLPGYGERVNYSDLAAIVKANHGKRGFAYTHKHTDKRNHKAIARANAAGFTVNLSADSVSQVDYLISLGIGPVVAVVQSNQRSPLKTTYGNKIIVCPAVTRDDINCLTCGLCAIPDRKVVIGFPAHGINARAIDSKLIQIGE